MGVFNALLFVSGLTTVAIVVLYPFIHALLLVVASLNCAL